MTHIVSRCLLKSFNFAFNSLTGLAGFFMSLSRRALAISVAFLAPFLARVASSSSSSSSLFQRPFGRGWKEEENKYLDQNGYSRNRL